MSKLVPLKDFGETISPLMDKWKSTYTVPVIRVLHEKFGAYSLESLGKAVNHLLINSHRAPLEGDFVNAFATLRLRPDVQPTYAQVAASLSPVEDIVYHLTNNIWANKTHIFIRGPKPSFIIKEDHPENDYVRLDKAIGSEMLKEAREQLKNNTYGTYVASKNVPRGTREVSQMHSLQGLRVI
jgi:hypothetical protein